MLVDCKHLLVLTKHVAVGVLATSAIGNVRLDTEKKDRQRLNIVFSGVQTPDDAEPTALVHVVSNQVQPWAKVGERKVVTADEIAVQAKS